MSQESISRYCLVPACTRHGIWIAILNTFPPLQSTKDPVAPRIATLLRKALPAQALAITGTAKYLRKAKAARIVAECGAGKTYMALGAIHVLADGRPSTTLVMCPSHITHKWAREVLVTIPRARTFLIEDLRNGGDPRKAHGVCEVKLRKGRVVYEGMRLSLVRSAADEPPGVAQEVPGAGLLHHRQGQGQARLLLGARLSQSEVRAEPGRRRQSRHGPCDSRFRAAEADLSRFRRQGQALGIADSATGRNDAVLGSVAGRPRAAFSAWRRSSLWAATCGAGSISPSPTSCTSWPATRRRATAWACWNARPAS